MRIALVVPQMAVGGVETVILRLGAFLKELGNAVYVVSTYKRGRWWDLIREYGLESECIDYKESFSSVHQAFKVGAHLSKQSYEAIVLNHSKHGQAALKFLPPNTVAIPVIHNDEEGVYRVACANKRAWNVLVGVSPKVCERARLLLSDKPVVYIPNGVEMPRKDLWEKRAKLGKKLKLLFAGRVRHLAKGVFLLPGIIMECRRRGLDVDLTIIGDGPDLKTLQERMYQLKLDDTVDFCGSVPPAAVYEEMLLHHVLLMPSFFEGLPVVPLEAQACGCVPIASRLAGITDIGIQDGLTGLLVNAGDVAGFADAIEKIYRDHLLWHEMSINGHNRVENEFSVRRMGEAYLKVIMDAREGGYAKPLKRGKKVALDLSLFSWREFFPRREGIACRIFEKRTRDKSQK